MNWFRKFMMGRSGSDQLSVFLLVISIVMTWTGQLAGLSLLIMTSYVVLLIALFRIFSKDVSKRRTENYQFLMRTRPARERLYAIWRRVKGSGTHYYFRCENCRKKLRVPKGKGKILVTCPICKMKTIRQEQIKKR